MTDSTLLFLRYELDADGHAYQLLAVGEEHLQLYPVLDAISFEHALEVEQTILPAIVELFEADPQREAFNKFPRFSSAMVNNLKNARAPSDEAPPTERA